MSYERIGEDLKRKAKEADLVSYLKARHPRSVRFSDHPDKPGFVCWRSVEHDSLTFYRKEERDGRSIYKYTRHSTDETDDGISYLVRYEEYSFINAIKAPASFEDSQE